MNGTVWKSIILRWKAKPQSSKKHLFWHLLRKSILLFSGARAICRNSSHNSVRVFFFYFCSSLGSLKCHSFILLSEITRTRLYYGLYLEYIWFYKCFLPYYLDSAFILQICITDLPPFCLGIQSHSPNIHNLFKNPSYFLVMFLWKMSLALHKTWKEFGKQELIHWVYGSKISPSTHIQIMTVTMEQIPEGR